MSDLIISVSGLRGKVGETLTASVVERYLTAYVQYLNEKQNPGHLVLAYDGRESGLGILEKIERTLDAHGISYFTAGVAATPTLGVLVRHQKAAGGIQITASHNPHPWNGLKLFSPEGRVLPKSEGERVKNLYAADSEMAAGNVAQRSDQIVLPSESPLLSGHPAGASFPAAIIPHLDAILKTVHVKNIRQRKFRVLLDANHGSGSVLGRALLEELGCDVIFASENDVPDGNFVHTPEPTEENLSGVCFRVPESGTDIGFCQDPDADRLAVIDASGRYIGEEYTVALCAEHILSQESLKGPVVTNCSTSLMTRDIARKYGVPFSFSPVGEANVVDEMLKTGAIFAGEGNGGPIDPRVGYVRDSFVGMAQILDMMAARQQPVAELAAALPRYEIVKTKISATPEELPAIYARFIAKYPDAEISRMDGLRLGFNDGWVLIRGSNTEPVVRIIAEAKTREEAQRRCELN